MLAKTAPLQTSTPSGSRTSARSRASWRPRWAWCRRGRTWRSSTGRTACVSFLQDPQGGAREDGKSTKTFWIEPKGAALCLWNEDCLSEPSEAPLIITEGELDALSFLASGATHVVSVPNGAALEKPGEGDDRSRRRTAPSATCGTAAS